MLHQNSVRRLACVLIFILFISFVSIKNYVNNASAASVTPILYSDSNDKDLPNEIKNLPSVKFESSGTQYLDGKKVTVEFLSDNKHLYFISDVPIAYVFVKGGPDGYLYKYNPPVYTDNDLYTPTNRGG